MVRYRPTEPTIQAAPACDPLTPARDDANLGRQAQVKRRDFLAAASATLGGLLLNVHDAKEASSGEAKGFIDAHVHVWTDDVAAYPLAPGFRVANMKPANFPPSVLMEHARPVGVTRVVLIQMSFYRYDNSYMLATMKKYPGVFSGVAIVDQTAPDVGTKIRSLASQGVRGLRIRLGLDDPTTSPEHPSMRNLWREATAAGVAICPLINPPALADVDTLCIEHPETRVVIDHFARIGIDGEVKPDEVKALTGLARHPNVYVKTSAFYALGKKKPPYADLSGLIKSVLDAYGPSRLMWASDCPFQVEGEHSYAASIDLIKEGLDFLSPDDKDWMLRRTAEKVFFS
ncbi:4-sulfomuconolactone hydrolase [Planctomycetes bacterium Pan216]|uniref:4-sulfomuconolactone hydrolase n=1 Tax=Kolteria novifilia TaxID=2527975 RepID=A0A518B0D0_9BACT|nr:4-sulfomuconolactone hydrolase [Planctomycetes bacterium Pan216]